MHFIFIIALLFATLNANYVEWQSNFDKADKRALKEKQK